MFYTNGILFSTYVCNLITGMHTTDMMRRRLRPNDQWVQWDRPVPMHDTDHRTLCNSSSSPSIHPIRPICTPWVISMDSADLAISMDGVRRPVPRPHHIRPQQQWATATRKQQHSHKGKHSRLLHIGNTCQRPRYIRNRSHRKCNFLDSKQ